jgi:secondary thiamine-phosphate synthase enzyme
VKSKTSACRVTTERRLQFIDVTEELCRAVAQSGVAEGCAIAYCRHTTCGLLLNEFEEGALDDFRRHLGQLVPAGYFAHDDPSRQNFNEHERINGRAHVTEMILGGTSHAIPVSSSEPLLGTWQRLILVELDEQPDGRPLVRELAFYVFGE